MFTVEAKRNVLIESLVINSSSKGEGAVKVYTRRGGYAGHTSNPEGWYLVYNNPALIHGRRGQYTELGGFQQNVFIAEGMSQSFFVTSTRGVVYRAGTEEGALFVTNEDITILQGIGTTSKFSNVVYSPRIWGGVMRYNVVGLNYACGDGLCAMTEDSHSCPADCAGKELETTFKFNLGSSGVMFTVKALRDISITSLVVNAMSRGEGTVKVYTRDGSYNGHELKWKDWELIYNNPAVIHGRRGQYTELGGFQQNIPIAKGETQSFFVISTKGLVYKAGKKEGDLFTSNNAIEIYEGIGTTDEISGAIYSPRVFGGIVR